MLAELASREKVVGVKQSLRALREGRAETVYLACDADPMMLAPVEGLCAERGVKMHRGATMAQLGMHGGIAVGASVVTLLKKA